MADEIMNVKQVSQYLHVNEKKVYSLVGKEGLPGTKATCKWLFPKRLVDEWLTGSLAQSPSGRSEEGTLLMAVGSDDPLLTQALGELNRDSSEFLAYFGNAGSTGGLRAVADDRGQLAGCHLWDAEDDSYNRSQVAEAMPGRDVLIINFAYREQGFVVAPGNPQSFRGFGDLAREDLSFVNRQKGSGTRKLLDFHLHQLGIPDSTVNGYQQELESHFAVALAVLRGEADVGLAIRCTAAALSLDFIPVKEERYDLVIPQDRLKQPPVQRVLEAICSPEFRETSQKMPGYSFRDTGRIVFSSASS